jgi:catechol 2,3-dioxygenase-like lactoylglutathione lyase family enzyme
MSEKGIGGSHTVTINELAATDGSDGRVDLGASRGSIDPFMLWTMGVETTPNGGWPKHLPVGSLRLVRSSTHYDATTAFYRDVVGLEVIDEFQSSYGEDGTIFGLPNSSTHMEIVRAVAEERSADRFDQLVFYLPSQTSVEIATARLRKHGFNPIADAHPYWRDHGGVVFLDPDGRGLVYVSWVYESDSQPSVHSADSTGST